MRVGYDAIRYFNNRTGLGNYSRYLVSAMLRFGLQSEIVLFTPRTDDKVAVPVFDSQMFVITPPAHLSGTIGRNIWRTFRLGRVAQAHSVDIYHGLTHEIPADVRKTKVRTVVTMHDLIYLRLPELFKPVDRIAYDWKFRRSCRDADTVIAISEQTKRDLQELYQIPDEKIEVVYQGCNPHFFEPLGEKELQTTKDRFSLPSEFLLQVGTLEPRKNIERVLEALAISKVDMFLILAGRPTRYQSILKKKIVTLGLDRQVRILNDISDQDLSALYQLAKIMLYPSLFEGFGLPILESLASGTPVLTSKGTCMQEAGGPGGVYVDPYDAQEIATALEMLLSDEKRLSMMGEQGMVHARGFSQANMAKKISKIYQDLLA